MYRGYQITMTPDGWYHVNMRGQHLSADLLHGLKQWIDELLS